MRDVSEDNNHLINTQKTLKGGKLTLRQSMRKHILKTNQITKPKPLKMQKVQEIRQDSDYTEKYRGLETIQDKVEMARFIVYQRVKHSRQSVRKIKLFSRQTSRPGSSSNGVTIQPRSRRQNRQSRSSVQNRSNRQAFSSQTSREAKKKTIDYQISNSLTQPKQKSKVQFRSNNLDKRMNQYLNLILKKKSKNELIINQKQLKVEQLKTLMQGQKRRDSSFTVEKQGKHQYLKLAGNFYKKLKKQRGVSTCQSHFITIDSNGGDQLVKQLKKQNQFNKDKGFYSQHQYLDSGRVDEMLSKATARSFNNFNRSNVESRRRDDFNTISTLPYQHQNTHQTHQKTNNNTAR